MVHEVGSKLSTLAQSFSSSHSNSNSHTHRHTETHTPHSSSSSPSQQCDEPSLRSRLCSCPQCNHPAELLFSLAAWTTAAAAAVTRRTETRQKSAANQEPGREESTHEDQKKQQLLRRECVCGHNTVKGNAAANLMVPSTYFVFSFFFFS